MPLGCRSCCRSDWCWWLPDECVAFPFNLVRIPASKDAAQVERMVDSNRVLYDRIRGTGGVLYPVSAFPMSSEDWKDHFGMRWPLLHDAKRRYDPLGTLTPGYNVSDWRSAAAAHGPSRRTTFCRPTVAFGALRIW